MCADVTPDEPSADCSYYRWFHTISLLPKIKLVLAERWCNFVYKLLNCTFRGLGCERKRKSFYWRIFIAPAAWLKSNEAFCESSHYSYAVCLIIRGLSISIDLIRINSLHNRRFTTKVWCKFVVDVASLEPLIKRTIDWLELIWSRSWFSLSPAHVSQRRQYWLLSSEC